MKSKDRWLARFFHVFLTSIVLVLVFIKDTELRNYLYTGQLYYVFIYMSLVFASTLFYFITSLMDPGYAKSNVIDVEATITFNAKEEQNELLELNDSVDNTSETSFMLNKDAKSLRQRRCGFCDIIQPLRSKHCEECQQCVRRYDHHCPWLGNCVGERNHKFFLAFLLFETCLVTWTVYISYESFHYEHHWRKWFKHNWMILIMTIFLSVTLVVVGLLWVCHSYMMFTAQTTWEFMSRPRISYLKRFPVDYNPFDQGYIQNILSFICYFRVQRWDQFYPV